MAHLSDEWKLSEDQALNARHFFGGVCVPDPTERRHALEEIVGSLSASAASTHHYNQPASGTNGAANGADGDDGDDGDDPITLPPAKRTPSFSASVTRTSSDADLGYPAAVLYGRTLLETHINTVFRLAHECPFPDVRKDLANLLESIPPNECKLSKTSPSIGPSLFVAPTLVCPVTSSAPETRKLFEEIFCATCRLSHWEQLLGWHPSFLERYNASLQEIMFHDHGPLPPPWRHYIAIMAASRYHCQYLIELQEGQFLEAGGDREWLKGVAFAPDKLQQLCKVNAIIAHQPWTLSKADVQNLMNKHWSMAELVHAVVIMCTFHSLCGIIYGLGVTPELDMTWCPADPSHAYWAADKKVATTDGNAQILVQRLEQSKQNVTDAAPDQSLDSFDVAGTQGDTKLEDPGSATCRKSGVYDNNIVMIYEDFNVKSKTYGVFRTHEYSWKEHGLEFLNNFLTEAGTLIDQELDEIYNLTYKTVNNATNVDTGPFRRAIWYYTQRLYGVCYDDYNYKDVNEFLGKSLKSYIKKVACTPENVTYDDFRNLDYDFQMPERAHVALLAAEAHKQSSLLYGLYVLMQAYGGSDL